MRSRILIFLSSIFLTLDLAWAKTEETNLNLGIIAERVHVAGEMVARLMVAVCVVMGITMICFAFFHYRTHRINPKLVPLGKPVMYLVLGLVILAIPFAEEILGKTGRSHVLEAKKQKETLHTPVDIDAPLVQDNWVNDYNH